MSRITICVNEDTGIVQEVFLSQKEEDEFADSTPEYIINSYFWIGIDNKYDLDDYLFESEELKKKAYYPFSNQMIKDKIKDLKKGLEKYIKEFESFLNEWDEIAEKEIKNEKL
jgi:hypothetical protein